MLFRDKDGNLIEMNKLDFVNDIEYYRNISKSYGFIFNPKENNTFETILHLSKKGLYNNADQYNNCYRENIAKNHNISNI